MGMLLTEATTFGLDTLLQSASTVLTWFITSFGSILSFFMQNTALFIWFLVSLAGGAFVFFRKLF